MITGKPEFALTAQKEKRAVRVKYSKNRSIKSKWMLASCTLLLSSVLMFGASEFARATAYGSINNFDCVNDTGVEAHGFDIELDDIRSKDITYTFDYNHYGVPKITEDLTDPLHPKVLVRYASAKNPNGTWSAYTAIPSAPIAPTMGHQFTNPSINFGGEHFGVGFSKVPSAVKYNWLIDDGRGNLAHGAPVQVSTPTFTYVAPAVAAPAQIVAKVVPPPPPVAPPLRFGEATWVKDIKTTTHNAKKVKLVDLVGDDPGKPQPWANGEPAEVETEWRILQTEFAANKGGKNGELKGAAQDLPNGNEVVTRRYEFYKYIGPIDAESGEAMGDAVGKADPDGIHFYGIGVVTFNDHLDPFTGEWVTKTVDLSKVWVVGSFFGAQMAGVDVAPNLGLIDHIQDGEVNVPYAERSVVIAGGAAFQATIKTGLLPDGLTLNKLTGVLSGAPTKAGTFAFTVQAFDTTGALITKDYIVNVTDGGAQPIFTLAFGVPTIIGGQQGQGVVTLSSPATADTTVSLSSSKTSAAKVPANVKVLRGSSSANFLVNTSVVSTKAIVTITGKLSGVAQSAAVTVLPIQLTTFTLAKTSALGGTQVSATVSLNSAAVVDTAVTFTSSDVSVAVPASVTIPKGGLIATVNLNTSPVAVATTANLTAKSGAITLKKTLKVTPPTLSTFTLSPTMVKGGATSTGAVTLTGAAPTGGYTLTITSGLPIATVPASITVPAGATTATFTINTSVVATTSIVKITVGTKSANLKITP